ncbi:MAG TPA: adenosylcobinamide-GDP ribazoletransferase [Terracidiphilus sp.]|jgi:adenosylcobinamide-GDP ribazoletransferase
MNLLIQIRRLWFDLLTAVQFLTRLRVPSGPYEQDSLARAVKFFPIVGILIGSGSLLLYVLLAPHLPLTIVALLVVVYLVAITGCLHEDGLADSADGFGGGGEREKVLAIMRDSHIGVYGAAALALSLLARVLLIASLPHTQVAAYLLVAPVLSRWTTLPLSFFLPPARERSEDRVDGQGARIARLTSPGSLIVGSLFTFVIVFALLRVRALVPALASVGVALTTALYYKHRIGGITGDCFGATNQLAEIAVYLCGVWA